MAKKKSLKKSAKDFEKRVGTLGDFLADVGSCGVSDRGMTYAYELAVIKLYTAFERLMLDCIVGAVNNDTTAISTATGIKFPKDLTDEVCEYLVVGTGYFDFRGRDGLIKKLKEFVPATHYLVTAVKKSKYKDAIDRLIVFRNFAAHESDVSKRRAKLVADTARLASAGSWLKVQRRYEDIAQRLAELADELHEFAPY